MREKTSAAIYGEIKKTILHVLEVEEEKVSIDTRFAQDLEADSLHVVEILMQLEERYSIDIPDDIAPKMKTVRQMVEYIEERLRKQ